jgi:hypothetical protein
LSFSTFSSTARCAGLRTTSYYSHTRNAATSFAAPNANSSSPPQLLDPYPLVAGAAATASGTLPNMILRKQDSQIDDFLDILNRIKRYTAGGKLHEFGYLTSHFNSRSRARPVTRGSGLSPIRVQRSTRVASSV